MILEYKGKIPNIHQHAFIAPDAVITGGDVEIGEFTSVWFKTVIRGDVAPVKIGHMLTSKTYLSYTKARTATYY